MKTTVLRGITLSILTSLALSAVHLSAQTAAPVSPLEPAKAAMERKDYRTAAREATKIFFFSGSSDTAAEALNLSITANAELHKTGSDGSWSAELDKTAGRLLVLTGEQTISRCFSIQCGEEFSVPSGEFLVGAKLAYPNLELNGILHKRGSDGNTLGSRWIELCDTDGVPVAGIHGEAPLAGDGAEQLFFRMKNSDVNELFVLLKEGSRVLVR